MDDCMGPSVGMVSEWVKAYISGYVTQDQLHRWVIDEVREDKRYRAGEGQDAVNWLWSVIVGFPVSPNDDCGMRERLAGWDEEWRYLSERASRRKRQ